MEFNFWNTFLLLSSSYLFANWFSSLEGSQSKIDLTDTVPLSEFRRTLWKEAPELYANFDNVFCQIKDHYENGIHVNFNDSKKRFGICKDGYLVLHYDILLEILKMNKPIAPFAED